jgi:hypothetical protein
MKNVFFDIFLEFWRETGALEGLLERLGGVLLLLLGLLPQAVDLRRRFRRPLLTARL